MWTLLHSVRIKFPCPKERKQNKKREGTLPLAVQLHQVHHVSFYIRHMCVWWPFRAHTITIHIIILEYQVTRANRCFSIPGVYSIITHRVMYTKKREGGGAHHLPRWIYVVCLRCAHTYVYQRGAESSHGTSHTYMTYASNSW